MTWLLFAFIAAAALLWLSVFGYLLALGSLALHKPRRWSRPNEQPAIAIVVPTLNEEAMVLGKLQDLARIRYPSDLINVVVVDGGSTDRTVALVEDAIAAGTRVHLWRIERAASKADQINRALSRLSEEIVIVTDADTRLEPNCVAELVATLLADPQTAIVGATVRPASALLEERIHWWFLNHLWWLEGEALSAAIVSGVCYAARRRAVLELANDAMAEDVHLALGASGRGLRVRLARSARATEMRVPQDARELFHFRRRRGARYVRELRREPPPEAPIGWKVARFVRLLHFRVTPMLAAATLLASVVLLFTSHWPWPLLVAFAFVVPAAVALFGSKALVADCDQRWRLGLAASRLIGLLWLSLVAADRSVWVSAGSGE